MRLIVNWPVLNLEHFFILLRYYLCSNADVVATAQFFCPTNYAFDPTLPDEFPCRYTKGNAAYCITASCANPLFRYPFFPTSLGQFGVSCDQQNQNPRVFRCSGFSTFSSDADQAATCTGQCSYDGQRFANIAGGHQSYNVCALNAAGNAYQQVARTCSGDATYNAAANVCMLNVAALRRLMDAQCRIDQAVIPRLLADVCPPN